MSEHLGYIEKKDKKSATARHIMRNRSHIITLDSASLIEKENRYFHSRFKESLYIRKTNEPMNTDLGMNLDPIWIRTLLPIIKSP